MADRTARILDTSALLALRGNEDGADRVERVLAAAKRGKGRVLLSFMTRMEILYLVRRVEGEESARDAIRLVDTFPIEWVGCEPDILDAAASLKSKGGLSVADSWIGATAVVRGATLLHRDPEYTRMPEIPQEWLGSPRP